MEDPVTAGPVRRSKCLAACDSCKRRKERCDSTQPCRRCTSRGFGESCCYSANPPQSHARAKRRNDNVRRTSSSVVQDGQSNPTRDKTCAAKAVTRPPAAIESMAPVPVYHPFGFALLRNVRRVVQRCLGRCDFLSDLPGYAPAIRPLRHSAASQTSQSHTSIKPSLPEAQYYVGRFLLATSWWLDIDTTSLLRLLPDWLNGPLGDRAGEGRDIQDAVYYMVLAIGAQTCPEERDNLAETYFHRARLIAAELSLDEPSITLVQSYCLVSMYLLGESKINPAFAHVGMAVKVAHVLGLHREEYSAQLNPAEYQLRERVWKSLRFLDTFLSALTGLPASTRETRDTDSEARSPALGICHIYEKIMSDVYTRGTVHEEAISLISKKQRLWATRLTDTLVLDSIQNSATLAGSAQLNISLLHVKQSFHCSIILLTWPSFLEQVEKSIRRINDGQDEQHGIENPPTEPGDFRTFACIDSAIRMIDVLAPLQQDPSAPKRLPVIMNSAFVAALVIGAALFAKLDKTHPLAESMRKVIALFRRFPFDPLACRFGDSVEKLNGAWEKFQSKQAGSQRRLRNRLFSETFGTLDDMMEDRRDGLDVDQTIGGSLHGMAESDPSPWDIGEDQQVAMLESVGSLDPSLLPDPLLEFDFNWANLTPALTELESSWNC